MNVKLIARFGQPPNLSWLRLKNMSEKEIEQFNCGHMREVEMSDEAGKKEFIPLTKREADIANMRYVEAWNAAIDKCIEVANKYDSYGPAYEMRMLKK